MQPCLRPPGFGLLPLRPLWFWICTASVLIFIVIPPRLFLPTSITTFFIRVACTMLCFSILDSSRSSHNLGVKPFPKKVLTPFWPKSFRSLIFQNSWLSVCSDTFLMRTLLHRLGMFLIGTSQLLLHLASPLLYHTSEPFVTTGAHFPDLDRRTILAALVVDLGPTAFHILLLVLGFLRYSLASAVFTFTCLISVISFFFADLGLLIPSIVSTSSFLLLIFASCVIMHVDMVCIFHLGSSFTSFIHIHEHIAKLPSLLGASNTMKGGLHCDDGHAPGHQFHLVGTPHVLPPCLSLPAVFAIPCSSFHLHVHDHSRHCSA